MFHKATREKLRARLFIMGAPGDGKTYTALRMAAGLADGGAVFVIDTHEGQSEVYAGQDDGTGTPLDYMAGQVSAPYTLQSAKKAIQAAVDAGAVVVLFDSFSDLWEGPGGLLDQKGRASGNSYTLWQKFGDMWRDFCRFINRLPAHVVVTSRRKVDYVLVENSKGRQEPRAVGFKPLVREGTEYEFDFVLSMMNGTAKVTKTRAEGLFPINSEIRHPGAAEGVSLLGWLQSGSADVRGSLIEGAWMAASSFLPPAADVPAERVIAFIESKFAPLDSMPLHNLRGLPAYLLTEQAVADFKSWNTDAAPRHAAQPGRQRPSNPPRRIEGDASAGGEADAEAQRQATLNEVFAGFKSSCDGAGYTIGRGIYCAALGKPAALNDMRAWNSPPRWREEFARMRKVSGASLPVLVNEAAVHVDGMDGARLLAELMAKASVYGEGCNEVDHKLAAGLLAERITRKPAETLKALGLGVVK